MLTETPLSGLLLVDKPSGITSFDCIRRLRGQTGVRKIGHAGTLDPLATGLMLMLFGAATKQATTLLKQDKTYSATITLGSNSTTGDAEGDLVAVSTQQPSNSQLAAALNQFTGEIAQTPPAYSAIKINGRRAYQLARQGAAVEMPSRMVTIHRLTLLSYHYPYVQFEATVSSGTYIRTLGEDIGKVLGVGAYLSALRRTATGGFSIRDAHALDEIQGSNLAALLMKTPLS